MVHKIFSGNDLSSTFFPPIYLNSSKVVTRLGLLQRFGAEPFSQGLGAELRDLKIKPFDHKIWTPFKARFAAFTKIWQSTTLHLLPEGRRHTCSDVDKVCPERIRGFSLAGGGIGLKSFDKS